MEQLDGKQTNQNCNIISRITDQLEGSKKKLNLSMSFVKLSNSNILLHVNWSCPQSVNNANNDNNNDNDDDYGNDDDHNDDDDHHGDDDANDGDDGTVEFHSTDTRI